MPIDRLDATVDALPRRQWDVDDLAKLRKAAGKRVNAAEAAWFRELLAKKWKQFSEPARRALEVLAGKAAPDVEPTRLEYSRKFTTGIEEQSAITFVSPERGFLLVDDETSCVWQLAQPGAREKGGVLE